MYITQYDWLIKFSITKRLTYLHSDWSIYFILKPFIAASFEKVQPPRGSIHWQVRGYRVCEKRPAPENGIGGPEAQTRVGPGSTAQRPSTETVNGDKKAKIQGIEIANGLRQQLLVCFTFIFYFVLLFFMSFFFCFVS